MYKYDAKTGTFYDSEISPKIPKSAVEVPDELYESLFDYKRANGKEIIPGPDGLPMLADPKPAPPDTREQIMAKRGAAYRSESDPIKTEAEYDAISVGNEPDYSEWLAKVAEIKNRYPMPDAL